MNISVSNEVKLNRKEWRVLLAERRIGRMQVWKHDEVPVLVRGSSWTMTEPKPRRRHHRCRWKNANRQRHRTHSNAYMLSSVKNVLSFLLSLPFLLVEVGEGCFTYHITPFLSILSLRVETSNLLWKVHHLPLCNFISYYSMEQNCPGMVGGEGSFQLVAVISLSDAEY